MEIKNRLPIHFISVDKIDHPERYLDRCVELLEGEKWCFAFGTALGLYRERGFIPRDTDIDIMVLDGDSENLRKIFETEWELIRTVEVDGKFHQLAFQDNNNFIIDLCFFYSDGDDWVSYCEGGYWRDSKDVIGDFLWVETRFGSYPVPEKIEDYLVGRYGDWQTPLYGQQCCSRKEV
jgi:hypothetical protein